EIDIIIKLFELCTEVILNIIEPKIIDEIKSTNKLYIKFYLVKLNYAEDIEFSKCVKNIISYSINEDLSKNRALGFTSFENNSFEILSKDDLKILLNIITKKLNKKELKILLIEILNELKIGIIMTIKLIPLFEKLYGKFIIKYIVSEMKSSFIENNNKL
ncbi:MAG: hypothetical protein ABF289_11510, partial [Clostridiales bacterium]